LKPEGPITGYVDGAWWPRSLDLGAELPALVSRLAGRLGGVERVGYHIGDWVPTGSRMTTAGKLVRLGGFHFLHPGTVDVLGPRLRMTLLVVPAETPAEAAALVMTRAASPGNTEAIEGLFAHTATRDTGTGSEKLRDH
jgi:hypothetical protein